MFNVPATSHVWPQSIWNMARGTGEFFILFDFELI